MTFRRHALTREGSTTSRAVVEGIEVSTEHWIGGERVPSTNTFDRRLADRRAARSRRSHAAAADETERAVAAARAASATWGSMPPKERAEVLHRVADGVEARVPELAAVETRDNGSLLRSMRSSVMPRVARNFRFFADQLLALETGLSDYEGFAERVAWDPSGVTVVITPWNAPLMLATWRVAPALAAGNAVILKPPEWAPLTASMLADIAREAGLPDGAFNVLQGIGDEAGAALTAHPGVDRIAFTGSVPTGKLVAQAGGANLTPVSLELGGKSPFVAFADADLDAVVRQAVNQFDNAGQVCLAGTRLIVERSMHDAFLERFVEAAGAIVQGDPREEATDIGPQITRQHFDRVDGFVQRAKADGATVVLRRRAERGPRRPLLPPDAVRRCARGLGDPHARGLRSGADPADLRDRGRGGRARQRHRVRARGDRVHGRRGTRRSRELGAGGRHRVGQLLLRARSCGTVRRGQGLGHRP